MFSCILLDTFNQSYIEYGIVSLKFSTNHVIGHLHLQFLYNNNNIDITDYNNMGHSSAVFTVA
jgi:glycine betaine/choline ABC-type transport system substrate-binding protein